LLGRVARAEQTDPETQGFPFYIGEIRMFAGDFAPAGWAFCEGQLLPISQYEALFNLIGTTYGGDGQETFALPDLRGRAPIHMNGSHPIGEWGGQEEVFLPLGQIPSHSHGAGASSANGSSDDPTGRVPARNAAGAPQYGTTANASLASGALLSTGGTTPHNNLQPYLCVHYILCLEGVFPSP
jgi:microcystin-dependent protein